MPTGPKGEKRPADVNARAVMIAKIATGEIDEKLKNPSVDSVGLPGGLPVDSVDYGGLRDYRDYGDSILNPFLPLSSSQALHMHNPVRQIRMLADDVAERRSR